MRTLLPRMKEILFDALSPTPTRVKTVDCRPNAWIEANRGATKYPAIFLWPDGGEITESEITREALRSLKVVMTIIFHSMDPNHVVFNEDRGVFALTEKALTVFAKNKRLSTTDDPEGVVTGMQLPISTLAGEAEDEGSAFVVSTVSLIEFWREGIPWTSWRNDESSFI